MRRPRNVPHRRVAAFTVSVFGAMQEDVRAIQYLGRLADRTSIETVCRVCACVPAIGMLAAWLPELERTSVWIAA